VLVRRPGAADFMVFGQQVTRIDHCWMGPSQRSPIARSVAPAVRGASGMVMILPPFRVIVRVRWPRTNSLGMAEQARSLLDELEACPPAHETPEHAAATARRLTGDRQTGQLSQNAQI
jgi:hypothetical protein